jgi:hypothetical protein
MDNKIDILDIMRYSLNRKSFQENEPSKFLEVEKFFQNEDNRKKFLETDKERNWDELLDLNEIHKTIVFPKKKKSFTFYLLPLAAILFLGLDLFLFIGRILFNKESSNLSFTDTNIQPGIFYSDGFILLFFFLACAASISFFYFKKNH